MFLETICIKNGIVQSMEAHRKRIHDTALSFGFHAPELPGLSKLIPAELKKCKKLKCSLVYHEQILNIAFTDYRPKQINSLKLVEANVNYSFKYADRSALDALLQEKGDCDEILMVKKGYITDTSFSNVVFRKNDELFTPDTYLLNGIKRQQLLRENKIRETRIRVNDLHHFDKLYLINAMLDIEDNPGLDVERIRQM